MAHPYLQSDEDAEAYIEEQQTSSKLRKFLDNMSDNGSVIIKPSDIGSKGKTVDELYKNTVKQAALKKTIKDLEDRIHKIRRQLGDQE